MSGDWGIAGWCCFGVFAVLWLIEAAWHYYWQCRCGGAEASADERGRQIDRLWDERREAQSKRAAHLS